MPSMATSAPIPLTQAAPTKQPIPWQPHAPGPSASTRAAAVLLALGLHLDLGCSLRLCQLPKRKPAELHELVVVGSPLIGVLGHSLQDQRRIMGPLPVEPGN